MELNTAQLLAIEYAITVMGAYLAYKCFSLKKDNMNYFMWFVYSLNFFLIINIPIRYIELHLVSWNHDLVFAMYALSIVLMTYSAAYWSLFILKQLGSKIVANRFRTSLFLLPAAVSVPLCIINYWTGWLYVIDESSFYSRGSIFFLQSAISYGYILAIIGNNIFHLIKDEDKSIARKCLFSSMPSLIASVLQILYGGSYLLLGSVLTGWCMYIEICLDRQRAYELSEAVSAINEELVHSSETVANNMKTILALADLYYILYEVDIKNDTFKEIKAPDYISEYCKQFTSARKCMSNIPKEMFDVSYHELVTPFFNPDQIDEYLANTSTYSVDARGIQTNEWIRATMIAAERDGSGKVIRAVYTIQEIGDIKAQQEQFEEAKEFVAHAQQMKELFVQTAEALAGAIDAKDKYTHGHSVRVAEYSREMAKLAGKSEEECEEVYFAGLLHDVGKIGIPDTIITKDGKLSDDEYAAIKKHPAMGKQILASIDKLPYLSIGANSHHERYDGHGYPESMKGTDIPELARIIAVADAYDAMTSKRSYRDPLPQPKVREEILRGSGSQFDPVYAELMLQMIDKDTDYQMKEKVDVEGFAGNEDLHCVEYGKQFSEGLSITPFRVRMHFTSKKNDVDGGLPSVRVFDALDGRVHFSERDRKNMNYIQYCDIRADGVVTEGDARKMEVTKTGEAALPEGPLVRMEVDAVKWRDHLYVTVSNGHFTTHVIIALPDSTHYAYLAVTGEQCHVYDVNIEKEEQPCDPTDFKRIAEEITYIEGPEGDIPSIQINGWRFASSEAIPLKDKLELSFHMKSLPSARLIWHLPFVIIYSADDKTIGGENYREFAFIRFDGESWQGDPCAANRMIVNKKAEFIGWDEWKVGNKQGRDCNLTVIRNGNELTMNTECGGIELTNITTIQGEIPDLYFAFTGDQCVVENIRILS